jgi:hypothetical protein
MKSSPKDQKEDASKKPVSSGSSRRPRARAGGQYGEGN